MAALLGMIFAAMVPPDTCAQDTLVLKNGRRADCRVLDFTADTVKITFRPGSGPNPVPSHAATPSAFPAAIPAANSSTPAPASASAPPASQSAGGAAAGGGGTGVAAAAVAAGAEFRAVPLADVDYVELAPLPGEAEAGERAVRESRPEPLLEFWARRAAWLNRPRCNAGELGLTYAELLCRQPTPDRLERALKIYQQIETGDWSAGRRGRAQAGRLRVMLRQGRTAEVRPLAEELLSKNGDPRVLIDLRHVLAEAAAASLEELEREHPRWREEEDLIPRHERLKNEALDGYLFPHLFHGAEEDLAARGLWAAARLARAQGDAGQAADWALDLTRLYPSSSESPAAAALMKEHPPAARTRPGPSQEPGSGEKPPAAGKGTAAKPEPETARPEDGGAPPPEKPKRKSRAKSKTAKTPPVKEAGGDE